MGFYFRKSISFGGMRLNFSKSGVGASVGTKGFCFGISPRGNYIHIGANGLYYKTMIGKRKNANSVHNEKNAQVNQYSDIAMHEIESNDALEIFDSSSQELVNEMNKKYGLFPFWVLGVILTVLLISTPFIVIGLLSIGSLYLLDRYRKTTIVAYDIDESTVSKIQTFYDTFNEIMDANRKWHISELGQVRDKKYHAGASTLIKRSNISISYSLPKYMKTNVKVPCIPVGKQKLYFFPDKILVVQRKKVGAVSYGSLLLECSNTRFIEDGIVPRDTTVVGQTWRYVNKGGGPDRRFKNNRQLPIVLYSELHFRSETGLNELLQVSRPDLGKGLKEYLNNSDFSYVKDNVNYGKSLVAF